MGHASEAPLNGRTPRDPEAGTRCRRKAEPAGQHFNGARVPRFDVPPHALQVGPQVRRRLISQLAIFLEAVVDHFLETDRQLGIQHHRRNRRTIEDRRENHGGGLAGKWMVARRALVEHDTQREKIGAWVELFAGRLLRRHVRYGPERDAGYGLFRAVLGRARFHVDGRQLRKPEVEDLHVTPFGHEDVSRLDIAVDDPFAVRRVQGVGGFDADVQELVNLDRPRVEELAQRPPLHQLHDDEGVSLELVDVVDRTDVRVVQRRRRAGFRAKPLHRLRIMRKILGNEFERNGSSEPDVFGAVNHAHAARSELPHHAIMRNCPSDHGHFRRPRNPTSPIILKIDQSIVQNVRAPVFEQEARASHPRTPGHGLPSSGDRLLQAAVTHRRDLLERVSDPTSRQGSDRRATHGAREYTSRPGQRRSGPRRLTRMSWDPLGRRQRATPT